MSKLNLVSVILHYLTAGRHKQSWFSNNVFLNNFDRILNYDLLILITLINTKHLLLFIFIKYNVYMCKFFSFYFSY